MLERHNGDINKLHEELDRQLPKKVKESSELLNLRKMEEHMAKQKKYFSHYSVLLRPTESRPKLMSSKKPRKMPGWTAGILK